MKLVVPPEWGRYLDGLLKLHKGYQIHFCISRGNLVFLSRHYSGKGPHLALRGKSPVFSRVAAGSLGFLSSCKRDLMDLLVLPTRSQVSFLVARGMSGFLSNHHREIGLCLEFCWSTQCSCPVVMGIWGFLSRFSKAVRPRLVSGHESLHSSRVIKGVSGFLLSSGGESGLLQEDQQGSQASHHVVRGSSVFLWSCCRGLRTYLELSGNSVSFSPVAGSSGFHSRSIGEAGLLWPCEGKLGFLLS